MPRRLSNIEWVSFQREIDFHELDLPPWGGIVEWAGMDVLVYPAPGGELFLTDVSDLAPQWKQAVSAEYDSAQEVWLYRLPEATFEVIAERAAEVSQALTTTWAMMPLFMAGALLFAVWRLTK